MRNPFRIQWNAYFYQYNLLNTSKQIAHFRTYNWVTYWANDRLVAPLLDSTTCYFDQMANNLARGYVYEPEEIDDAEENENIIFARLATLHANDCMRG
jgi:hypothetical protein